MGRVPSNPYLSSPRWAVAEQIADAVLRRYPAQIHAIGVHGALAHGDDADGADVDLVVVTFRPGEGPRPTSRRVNGVIGLAETGGREFVALAREAWCSAEATYAKSLRLAEWHDTDGALLTLCEARLSAAMVDGLLTRTYFRHSAEAVRRTGLGEADMVEVGRRLRGQAEELAKRGHPVDGTIADLLA